MNVLMLMLLSLCMVCIVYTLPIISKPLENNPDHLTWEEPFFMAADNHRSDDKTRKIPKSIFITPNLNESKENCPPDHKLGPDGKCYKTLKIDPLMILKTQIDALFKRNKTATTEYDDYDYSEYAEPTESMSSLNGKYPIPMSLGFASENYRPQQTPSIFAPLHRVTKDDSHAVSTTTVSFVSDSTDGRGVTGEPFLAFTIGPHLDSKELISKSEHEFDINDQTTSTLLASTITNPAITSMTITSTEATNTESFVSKGENEFQNVFDAESTDKTMNEEENITELAKIDRQTDVEEKSEKNDNELKFNETFIENKKSNSNERDKLKTTTETVADPLSNTSVSKPKQIENSTDLSTVSLSHLSQRTPEIEDILQDFSDKHPHFLGTIPSEIANDTTSMEELLIKPYVELSSATTDTLALSSQMVTEQYEWMDTLFIKPAETEQNDSSGTFSEENVKQSNSPPRLQNTHLISDEELLSLETSTTSESENDQQTNIELIPENQPQLMLTTDKSSNRKYDDNGNDNLNVRLAEESLFQPTNTMKSNDFDIESIKEFNSLTIKPSQINERALNDTDLIAAQSISDYVTTEETQDYDTTEANTRTEYLIKPKPSTEQSISYYSTFINRLKATSSIGHIEDRVEGFTTSQTIIDTSTDDEYRYNTSTDPTIEPSPNLIIKQPPNQGKSMRIANINCYLKNLVNEQYSQICT